MRDETAESSRQIEGAENRVQPGLLAVFSGSKPLWMVIPVGSKPLVLGRAPGSAGALLPDERLSRAHATITRSGEGWVIRDSESRNGTFVDGVRITGTFEARAPRVIRVADTILLPIDDIAELASDPHDGPNDVVIGTRLRRALDAVAHAAQTGGTLVIQGESGAGKEVAARTFHARGAHAKGPFVGVNCAAIPEGLAERLLFGAKRGAYSGAEKNAVGHVQAAHNGVLFLDEIGDLDAHVQAKLLRALETREVVPLGDSIGQPFDVRVCVATQKPLRAVVAEGKFRADLYYRLAPPEVALPPLRERLDEIPRHLAREIATVSPGLLPHVRLVEGCMLKAWPGNVRELRKEAHHAATRALADGSDRVRFEHLSETAGCVFEPREPAAPSPAAVPPPALAQKRSYVRRAETFTREHIERAIVEAAGNVATASRALGIHRAQLYREMARFNVRMPLGPSRD